MKKIDLLGNIHVLRNHKGGGVRKWQFLITFSTESNHKGGRGGDQKTQNLDYVIHGCSLGTQAKS